MYIYMLKCVQSGAVPYEPGITCVSTVCTPSNCVMLPQRSQGNPASPQLYLPGVFHNAVSHLQPVLGIAVLSPNSPPLCPTVGQLT